MKNSILLARKEVRTFFHSWTGMLVFAFFYCLAGVFFSLLVLQYAQISMESAKAGIENIQGLGLTRFVFSSLYINLSVPLLFLIPALTMRSFAEERKLQTLELLYSYPFSDFEIVWGKYLGLAWIYFLMLLPVAAYIGLVQWLGGEMDWGPILCGALGFLLLGNAYIVLGLFISTLTENQVVSAIGTFVCLILLWISDSLTTLSDGWVSHVLRGLSPLEHYREFALGILDLSHIVYFVFFFFFFLFLSLRSIETRNWMP